MGTSDGTVQGTTKIVDHGSDADRWNLVLVSEGYRSTQMGQFQTDAQNFVNTLFATAPFDTLQSAINVHRVDVTSTDSGADDSTACGGSGPPPRRTSTPRSATPTSGACCWSTTRPSSPSSMRRCRPGT